MASPGSALLGIQAAIYGVLSADSTLTGLCNVVGDISESTPFPYLLVSTGTEKPWHTMGGTAAGFGGECQVTCHIYSRYAGDYEALTILDRVKVLLDFVGLTVSGYATVLCEFDEARLLLEYPAKVEQRHIAARWLVRAHQ